VKDFKIGSLVKRKMYRGVLNSLHVSTNYGIITKIYTDGRIQVAFIQKGGEIKTKTLDGSKLTLIK
jgi:hypothetical protein|tara:strand:+ start:192 stop:389 length:198 start_codon:yes stop_codon:yes gene_type:complete